jgi:hypothetical protein
MKFYSVLFVFIALSLSSQAQFKKGDVELSGAFTLGNEKSSMEYTKGNTGSSSNSQSYLFFTFSPAFYITDGFAIEPELGFTAVEKIEPGIMLLANISYTKLLNESNTALFGHIGYGLSNASSIPGLNMYNSMGSVDHELKIGVFNVGAGLKFMIAQKVFLKTELNYRNFSFTVDRTSYAYDESVSIVSVLIGLGIVL